MKSPTIMLAFIAGLLSFLSPCILPVAPGYIGILSGTALGDLQKGTYDRRKILLTTLMFILGFSIMFIGLGAGSSLLGQALRSHRRLIGRVGGLIVIALGLHQTGLLPIAWLYREHRVEFSRTIGYSGAFLTGLAFAIGWTPCVGPILGSILALAGSQGDLPEGIFLLTIYASGLAVPFFLLALAFEHISPYLLRVKRYLKVLQWMAGGLLILMGVLMFTGSFSMFNALIFRLTGGWSFEEFLKKW